MKKLFPSTVFQMKTTLTLFSILLLAACTNEDNPGKDVPTDPVEAQLQQMTLRQKVGQLFFLRPESLDPSITVDDPRKYADFKLQQVGDAMRECSKDFPPGGILLYAHNISDPTQLEQFITDLKALDGAPLLCIDEEGGRVARIAKNANFQVDNVGPMANIGATGDSQQAYQAGSYIGTYLKQYGFDIDFAPVADVNSNPDNVVIGDRSFSSDPNVVAAMVVAYLEGLSDAGIVGCVKHFPGHGDTSSDTHFGYAQSLKKFEEIDNCELVPFRAAIKWGCQLIMSAHIALPNVTGSEVPCTMSPMIMTDLLRGQLGYQNIIVPDAIEMGAIMQQYTTAEATIGGLQAGVDVILNPLDYPTAFNAVLQAISNGTLTEERINQSVRRILRLKQQLRNSSK